MKKKPQVIDFFCGAGGFSEGFRQQGFEIVMGVDNWPLAIETHNLNHNLDDKPMDVLDFRKCKIEAINNLPDTEIIVGSPPCVLFSLSNKGGNVDKTLGIHLIEAFLRIVAVKKHQPSSKLVAWFMENVPNSRNYVKDAYTFQQLKLKKWAIEQKIDPDSIAVNVRSQGRILNTADFGTPQRRERFLCGEIIASKKFPDVDQFKIKQHRTVRDMRSKMPLPNLGESEIAYVDPNYPSLKLRAKEITDHFYDSGVYECQWKEAQWLKTNHYCMGKMAFPENEDKPSRTVMATQSASTREALIYKSEYDRQGDGQYRLPTIREIATLMGFPYSYRFAGGESNKWRQVGNAVSPHLSSVLAKSVRLVMGLQIIPDSEIKFEILDEKKLAKVENLNTFQEKAFDDPPKKNPKAWFRRHPFKDGNMTVALTNFNPKSKHKNGSHIDWFTSVYFGAGKDFKVNVIPRNAFKRIGGFIESQHNGEGTAFIEKFERHFHKVIGRSDRFQAVFVGKTSSKTYDPRKLVDDIANFILQNEPKEKLMVVPNWISKKEKTPTRQVLTIYAINRIIS